MARTGWITPDEIPASLICRALSIPDEPIIVGAVAGALLPLIYEENWEQVGAVTPAEMASSMRTMYEAFFQDSCAVTAEIDLFYHQEAQNVSGGGVTANTNFRFPYNLADAANVGNVTLSGNIFTLAPGRYIIRCEHILVPNQQSNQKCWIGDGTNLTPIQQGLTITSINGVFQNMVAQMYQATEFTYTIAHCGRASQTRATNALGIPANVSGMPEVYGLARFERIGDF